MRALENPSISASRLLFGTMPVLSSPSKRRASSRQFLTVLWAMGMWTALLTTSERTASFDDALALQTVR